MCEGWEQMDGRQGFDVVRITSPSKGQPTLDLELCVSWNVDLNSLDSCLYLHPPAPSLFLSRSLSFSLTQTHTHTCIDLTRKPTASLYPSHASSISSMTGFDGELVELRESILRRHTYTHTNT